jgi:predicted MPP superfamily phosphohydrolase
VSGAEQLELGLDLGDQPVHARRDDIRTWPGWRLLERADQVRALPGALLRSSAELAARWALRIALPLTGMAATVHSFPYRATVAGVPFQVSGTILHSSGLSADTTFGSWEFPAVDGLPFGVHVAPVDVDVLQLARSAKPSTAAYAGELRDGLMDQLPRIVLWLVAESILGLILGLGAAVALNMAVRYLRGLPRRVDELRHRARQLAAVGLVAAIVVSYGVASYNPDWPRQSRLTGTIAAAQLFPDQLKAYYQQQSKTFDVLGSVLGIQAALQAQLDESSAPASAFQIMFISDVHLAAVYPLIAQYAKNYDVKLIINTGDESEFGTRAELTTTYLASIAALTSTIPMIWLAGNHDSPDVEQTMASIPGVTVIGGKTTSATGYAVNAGSVRAFGLTVAGLPDPRVYGAAGAYGSDETRVTDPLERSAVDSAVGGGRLDGQQFDIFATHEPVSAAQLRKALPGQIRQTNSGHVHEQNATGDIQDGEGLDLIEGSTGAGGLDNIVRGAGAPPVEFSIESVAADCQFTRVLRFQLRLPEGADAANSTETSSAQTYGSDVTVSTVYFRPQSVASGRVCDSSLGIGLALPL